LSIYEDETYKELEVIAEESREKLRLATEKSKKKEFDDDEYSKNIRDLKSDWDEVKDAGKRRLLAYADRLKGRFGAGNKAAAIKVRDIAEGKEKRDKKKLIKDIAKGLGVEDEESGEEGTEKKPEDSKGAEKNVA